METRAITVEVPDDLAQRLERMAPWLPTVLELGLAGFRTQAVETASEIVAFLAQGPSAYEVAAYHASDRAQHRLRRLFALQTAGQLSADEQVEEDDLGLIEHILIMLKARLQREAAAGNVHRGDGASAPRPGPVVARGLIGGGSGSGSGDDSRPPDMPPA